MRSRACSRACAPPRRPIENLRPGSTRSSASRSGSRRRRRSISVERIDAGAQALRHAPPVGSMIVEWMLTSWNGTSPISSSPLMTIRATQRMMMSRRSRARRSGTSARAPASRSGQPSVANGHSADENQVSRTSSSCGGRGARPYSARAGSSTGDRHVAVGAVPDRDAVPPPELAADAPVADVLHPVEVDLGEALGEDLTRPSLRDGLDRRRRGPISHAPLGVTGGSIRVLQRIAMADRWRWGSLLLDHPALLELWHDASLASSVEAGELAACRRSFIARPGPITMIGWRPCARPISKSSGRAGRDLHGAGAELRLHAARPR